VALNAALTIRTREAFPVNCPTTQTNLGIVYHHRLPGRLGGRCPDDLGRLDGQHQRDVGVPQRARTLGVLAHASRRGCRPPSPGRGYQRHGRSRPAPAPGATWCERPDPACRLPAARRACRGAHEAGTTPARPPTGWSLPLCCCPACQSSPDTGSRCARYAFASDDWDARREEVKQLAIRSIGHYVSNFPDAIVDVEGNWSGGPGVEIGGEPMKSGLMLQARGDAAANGDESLSAPC